MPSTRFSSILAMGLSLATTQALAHGDETIVTDNGRELSIDYYVRVGSELEPATELNADVAAALICGEGVEKLESVVLWMPAHDHGSVPTRLENGAEPGCVLVDNVTFVMGGHWELRLSFTDGDKGTFEAHVHGDH